MPDKKSLLPHLKFTALLAALLIVFLLFGCGTRPLDETPRENLPGESTAQDEAEKILRSMSVAEKLGQMVMIGVTGTDADENSRFMLHQYHIGGIILFDRNLENAEQVKNFTANLQKYADGKIPLLIGIDEEGGRVVRMPHIVAPPPSAREIGDSGDPSLAEKSAEEVAVELKNLGFTVDFAPVADLGKDNDRSFADDPQKAAEFSTAATRGYLKGGVTPCLKHFPGLGKGQADTHIERTTVSASRDELAAEDIVPFKETIKKFSPSELLVMVSHIDYPALDNENPASLSFNVQTKLLRREVGFEGVIITDDTEMGAIANHYAFKDVGVKAVQAGADIVSVCHDYAHAEEVYLGLLDAAEQGTISAERIDESVRRILQMKLASQDRNSAVK